VSPLARSRNLITDVPGLGVGNAEDAAICSGVTVLLPDRPVVAAVDVRGGGPGTRETDALSLAGTVDEVHAIVLSGGSALGLGAASGVQSWLAERGIGFNVRGAIVPIVPQAILFDLLNGGDKHGLAEAYPALARRACAQSAVEFDLGSSGAAYGATTATLRGGLGSASTILAGGAVIGALVAVNAVGTVTIGDGCQFWAAPFEQAGECGGLGWPATWPADALVPRLKGAAMESTTLAIVATNARLSKRQAQRLAVMAQSGLARAIHPVHTPLDGDVVFALSTGELAIPDTPEALARLGASAADTLARAVMRGVYEAAPAPAGWIGPPSWRERLAATAASTRPDQPR
jgi:L-aminopeptidase/D-esterase-like protein